MQIYRLRSDGRIVADTPTSEELAQLLCVDGMFDLDGALHFVAGHDCHVCGDMLTHEGTCTNGCTESMDYHALAYLEDQHGTYASHEAVEHDELMEESFLFNNA